MKASLLCAATFSVMVTCAAAQGPRDELKVLEPFIGDWEATGAIHWAGQEPVPLVFKRSFAWILGGNFIETTMTTIEDGKPVMRHRSLIGWDADTQEIKEWGFWNVTGPDGTTGGTEVVTWSQVDGKWHIKNDAIDDAFYTIIDPDTHKYQADFRLKNDSQNSWHYTAKRAQDQAGTNHSQLKDYGPWIGTWRYEGPLLEEMPGMADKGSNCLIQISWKWGPHKNSVEESAFMEFADGTRLSGKALIGWNAADQAIVYGGINSLGGLSLGTVEFDRAEKTLTLTSEGVEPDGTKTSFQGVIKRTDRHTYEWHATKRTGGPLEGPSPTYVFHRVTQPKPSTDAIPQQVQDELGFMVGQWKSVVTVNGQELPVASHTRRWAPGRHGLVFTWQGEEDGKPIWASGLSGWNPQTKEVVEHWYDSLGRYGSVHYPLDKMTATLWEGTTDRFFPDGTIGKGTCRLEKGNGRWVFTVTGEEGGEPVTVKEVSEKVE